MSYGQNDHSHAPQSFWTRYVWSQDHKVIAVQYSLTAIAIGLVLSLIHISEPTRRRH